MFTRDPDPADAAQANPAAVVISGPTKLLVGNPGPAGVGINPVSVSVGSPLARLVGLSRLKDESVIARLHPITVGIELAIERGVGAGVAIVFNCRADGGRGRGDGRRGGGRAVFLLRERVFASVEIGLALRQFLLLVRPMLGIEALLHLAFDFGIPFRFGGLLLAGAERETERCEQREKEVLIHNY